MPNPTVSDLHVSQLLTQISIGYIQDAKAFVADRVFRNIPVAKQADRYVKYDRADFFRNQFKKRASGTESAGGGWKIDSTPTYFAEIEALHKDIEDSQRANQDSPLDMDRDATLWLAQQALIAREVNWAAKYFTPGVWTGWTGGAVDITGVAATPTTNQVLQWNDASSTPVADVKAAMTKQQILTGLRPNKMVLGRQVMDALTEHPDIIDRIKYGADANNPAIVNEKALAALFGVEEVMVADAIQATSPENKSFETSKTTALIAGKAALLVYVAPTPSLMQPSAGYTFSWSGMAGAGPQGMRVKKFRMEHLDSDRLEGQMAYDQKVVASDCGTFFTTIVA